MVLLYSLGDLPLRSIAGWFTGKGQKITDQAIRWRLKGCTQWLAAIIGQLLPRVELPLSSGQEKRWQLVIVDTSVVNGPATQGTDYRIHLSVDPVRQQMVELQVHDVKTGESLNRFHHDQNQIVLGDRGFAKAAPLIETHRRGAQFVVRMSPRYLPLFDEAGRKIDLIDVLRRAKPQRRLCLETEIRNPKSGEACRAYVHARRLSIKAGNQARRRARRKAQRRFRRLSAYTSFLSDWLLILTSLPPDILSGDAICELYRVRWQVELVIKRLKSLLDADALRVRAGSPLAELYILGKLLFALLVENRMMKRVGTECGQMIGPRTMTCWRPWQLMADEIREAVLNTLAYDGFDWREMLGVLNERKRKRRLQVIPEAVAEWLGERLIQGAIEGAISR